MSEAMIGQIVGAVVTLGGLLFAYLRLKAELKAGANAAKAAKEKTETVEQKVDAGLEAIEVNTKVTKVGIQQADKNAKVAVEAATTAKETTQAIVATVSKKLNGELTDLVESAVNAAVAAAISRELSPVVKRVAQLEKYHHMTKHDLANRLQAQTNLLKYLYEMKRKEEGTA